MEIVSLREDHLDEAAALVTRGYQSLRRGVPVLPERYESVDVILARLCDLLKAAPGAAAIEDGRLQGFLIGATLPSFRGRRCAYSPEWAHAAAAARSGEIHHLLYSFLSAQWMERGCHGHLMTLFAHEQDVLDEWFWLGFGQAAVDAVRDVSDIEQPRPQNLTIRAASPGDTEILVRLGQALEHHMQSAPIFLESDRRDLACWEQILREGERCVWLAWCGDQPAAFMMIGSASDDACLIIQDDRTASITGAFAEVAHRRSGIGTALLNQCLAWAREQGYERCAVDFEPMNIEARRFWLRFFEPVCYSLYRILE